MLTGAPLVPTLVKKFGKNRLFILSMATVVILSVITYLIARSNFTLFVILSMIKFLFSAPMLIISALYFVDVIEYEYLTKGKRCEAVTFSVQTFSNKATAAIAGSVPMFLLGLFGFQESIGDQVVVQTSQVINGIWLVYNLGPAFGALLALILFTKYYDLNEDKLLQMKEESKHLKMYNIK